MSDVVAYAIRNNANIVDAITQSGRDALPSVISARTEAKQTLDPNSYDEFITSPSFVSVAIAGAYVKTKAPRAAAIQVRFDRTSTGDLQLKVLAQDRDWVAIGSPKAINKLRELPEFNTASDLASALAMIEINSGNSDVELPLDVVKIRAEGPTWVEHKDGCPIEKSLNRLPASSTRTPRPT
jgi:hypothetical protein